MVMEGYDRDLEGQADEIAARERESALADLRSGIDRRFKIAADRCIKCNGRDWLTQKGNALCDDCQLALEESK